MLVAKCIYRRYFFIYMHVQKLHHEVITIIQSFVLECNGVAKFISSPSRRVAQNCHYLYNQNLSTKLLSHTFINKIGKCCCHYCFLYAAIFVPNLVYFLNWLHGCYNTHKTYILYCDSHVWLRCISVE